MRLAGKPLSVRNNRRISSEGATRTEACEPGLYPCGSAEMPLRDRPDAGRAGPGRKSLQDGCDSGKGRKGRDRNLVRAQVKKLLRTISCTQITGPAIPKQL